MPVGMKQSDSLQPCSADVVLAGEAIAWLGAEPQHSSLAACLPPGSLLAPGPTGDLGRKEFAQATGLCQEECEQQDK